MIPKIICLIFGHKLREPVMVGVDPKAVDMFGRPMILYDWKYWKICPRCGEKIN